MNLSALLLIELILLVLVSTRYAATAQLTLKEHIVLAFTSLATLVYLSTEIVSLFSLLYEGPILTLHILVVLSLLGLLCAKRRTAAHLSSTNVELPIIACAAVCAVPAFISALAAPPNNWDSMTYHLPRVFHWLQNHSLDHYATYVARQLYLAPGHEFFLTHTIALAGTDLHAGAINSAAFLIALLSTAAITQRLGGGRIAQITAVILCATIPMAILQSSSTQNDLLLATFLLSFILGALITKEHPLAPPQFMMWASAGLAVATKGLAFFYLPPAVLLFFPFSVYRRSSHLPAAALGLTLALMLNLGHWQRNYEAFGHPLVPTTGIHSSTAFTVQSVGLASTVSNLARNILLHSNSSFRGAQRWIQDAIAPLHHTLGIDQNASDTTWIGTGTWMIQANAINEDLAGNGNHLLLMGAVLALALLTPRTTQQKRLRVLFPLLCALAGLVFVSVVLKWQPWASRLHLTLFLVATPTLALVVTQRIPTLGWLIICIAFATQAYPYWAHNSVRPLAGSNSILHQPARLERYASKPFLYDEFRRVSKYLKQNKCREIGLVSSEDEWELPLFTNLYTRPTVHTCPAPPSNPRELWLPDRVSQSPKICALVWLGTDAPEQFETCGKTFTRVGGPQHVSLFEPHTN